MPANPQTPATFDRLFTGPDGRSRLERDLPITFTTGTFAPPAPPLAFSEFQPAAKVGFLALPADFDGDWHPSPERQWVICLDGEMDYEAGDGSQWRIRPGSFLLTEDTTGEGHRSRVVGTRPALLLLVQLPPEPA